VEDESPVGEVGTSESEEGEEGDAASWTGLSSSNKGSAYAVRRASTGSMGSISGSGDDDEAQQIERVILAEARLGQFGCSFAESAAALQAASDAAVVITATAADMPGDSARSSGLSAATAAGNSLCARVWLWRKRRRRRTRYAMEHGGCWGERGGQESHDT